MEKYDIISNNPLVSNNSSIEINKMLDANNFEHFMFFCRTYNYPANFNLFVGYVQQDINTCWGRYSDHMLQEGEIKYNEPTENKWKFIQAEWEKCITQQQLIKKIDIIRSTVEDRLRRKWGDIYTFEELMAIDNLFIATVKTFNITNPMAIDAIKKACRLSITIEQLITAGNGKEIKDLTAAYQGLLKMAKIDELAEMASEGTIKTVSDLYNYMEKHGFEFNFYDNVDRDIVDKTIKDIKDSIRNEIVNATGLDVTLEMMKDQFIRNMEIDKEKEAIEEVPQEELIINEDYFVEREQKTDKELDAEDVEFIDDDEY